MSIDAHVERPVSPRQIEPIAITGIGCRFAGGIDSPKSFWDFVVNKRDGVVDVPAERWDHRRFYDPDQRAVGRAYTKRGAFLDTSPWLFDAEFFGMSPREAAGLDPQQRLLLEVAWEALDDAGLNGRVAGKRVGVYVGGFTSDHTLNVAHGSALAHVDLHTAGSASFTMLSNRIAYALDLSGPALTIDTACSSSLVAFHQACRAIDDGDCDTALVGGVSMLLRPETFVVMCKGGFLSADGRCKSFSEAADGYGRGEGAGTVVLRRLDDALNDGDRIYAIVHATGANQDGRTPAITVPSSDAQEALAQSVCARSGFAPQDIIYVEAHGTGTPVGDPAELSALGHVYGAVSGREGRLPVGSAKATLGHTEAASGVAGVIKAALAVHHRTLPPQGWLDAPNPTIPFDELNLKIQTEAEAIDDGVERVAVAVNGFGYGGTNAHVILGSAPPADGARRGTAPDVGFFPLSGRSEAGARSMAGSYAELLRTSETPDAVIAASWTRRAHHRYRAGVVFNDADDLSSALQDIAAGAGVIDTTVRRSEGPVFVFTGMGPQWWAMGRELLGSQGAFAAEAHRIDAEFVDVAGWSIVEELLRDEHASKVATTSIAQPANLLIQAALTAELAARGVRPAAVVGHSVGEVTAAYISGALSLRDTVRVAFHRARLQARTAGSGSMLALGLAPDQIAEWVSSQPCVDVAAVNSPSSVTLAGDSEALEELRGRYAEEGVFARTLQVEVPYHSQKMDAILDDLREALAELAPRAPRLPLYSTVTASQVTGPEWDAEYWCANVRQTVRFAETTKAVIRAGHRIFVEVGPHPVLSANIREILVAEGDTGQTVATLNRKEVDTESLKATMAGLYRCGALDVAALGELRPAHVDLPRYPWQRQLLRHEHAEQQQTLQGTTDNYSMLGDPDFDAPASWQLLLNAQTLPWLPDHVVNGSCVLPGAAYLDAALSAAAARFGNTSVSVENTRFVAPLVIDPAEGRVLRTEIEPSNSRFTIRSRALTSPIWTVHASGRLIDGTFTVRPAEPIDATEMTSIDPAEFYAGLNANGLTYGSAFRGVTSLRSDGQCAVATVRAPAPDGTHHRVHPSVVDAALQVTAPLVGQAVGRTHGIVVPVGVDMIRVVGALPDECTVVARLDPQDPLCAHCVILDDEQHECARLTGIRFGSINPGRAVADELESSFYEEVWQLRGVLDNHDRADDRATLVISVGDQPHARAGQLVDALPVSVHLDLSASQLTDDTDVDVGAALAEALQRLSDSADRVHICIVAGHTSDDTAALWRLKTIAMGLEWFRRGHLVAPDEHPAPYGDDRMHVTLVTENALLHPAAAGTPNVANAALAGSRRVLVCEQPQLRWRLVDCEPATTLDDLLLELTIPGAFTPDDAEEIFLRDGLRWSTAVTRTLPGRQATQHEASALPSGEENFTLEVPRSRLLSDLTWRRCRRSTPGRGQVELRMDVVGLNYKDAVKVLGLLGDRELAPTHFGSHVGMEGVGTVVATGPEVSEFSVGDVVATTARGMLRRYVTVDTAECVKPAGEIDPQQCGSITPFSTAEHSLIHLARLRPGETVLVHGAAGGVGSAAIQVAKRCGAIVIGTARTEQRRRHVIELGADHVVDSRSLDFADDVMDITEGRGVDVVLSTAPGAILRRNFDVIGEFGRIIEINKFDIYTNTTLDMSVFDRNVSYFSVDIDRLLAADRKQFQSLLESIHEKFTTGVYQPLPVEFTATDDVALAFEEVFRSDRTSRVVVTLGSSRPKVKPEWDEFTVDPDGTYVITGGYGGLGQAVARWLVRRGARRLVLVSRSGPANELACEQSRLWRRAGVDVVDERLDVTDQEMVRNLVSGCGGNGHRISGIFHAAGSVADQRIEVMTMADLKRVYDAKVLGAKAIAAAVTEVGLKPDIVAIFSSGSSIFGLLGQYNYTAANFAVQAVSDALNRSGLRTICIGWGHMDGSGGGMASNETTARFLDALGFEPIHMDDGAMFLEESIRFGVTQAAIIYVDWAKLNSAFGFLADTYRTRSMIAETARATSESDRLRAALAELDEGKRAEVVAFMLAEQLAEVMGVSAESIDIDAPVTELGLDSLMGVEFGVRASRKLGVNLSTALTQGRVFDLRSAGAVSAEAILAGQGAVA